MSEAKHTHTPGPWEIEQHERKNGRLFIQSSRTSIIARLFASNDWVYENAEANARLIAAAPAMYEALTSLVAEILNDGKDWPALKLARAALRLAEGKDEVRG